MTLQSTKQLPISFSASHKSDVRTQFAALCYRIKNKKPEILLITSRGSKRWIIPKGWPMDGKTPGESALQEAWEEAGVRGKVIERCLGLYSYSKVLTPKKDLPCVAIIYPIKVKSLKRSYPEVGQRQRKWFSPKKAAARVEEPELAQILKTFDPRLLG
ncbi:MAG: NUDIX hydrolase [Rhodobacterales bacterium]|nr:NUDIX hydrolase [Rhodobacterales bacterium]